MPYIACDADKCIYNCDRGCCRNEIKVDGAHAESYEETECKSFSDKISSMTNTAACNSTCPCDNSDIECSATECIYNSDRICTADEIDVGTCFASCCSETRCETFTK